MKRAVRVTDWSQTERLVDAMYAANITHGKTATAQMVVEVVQPHGAPEIRFCNMPALTNVVIQDEQAGTDQDLPYEVELDMSVTQPGRYKINARLYSNGTIQVTTLGEPELVTVNQAPYSSGNRRISDVIGG